MSVIAGPLILSNCQLKNLVKAVKAENNVSGLTHNFYRYPARFSPEFAREVISIFSKPGDLVLDPFLGGGTTAVEAMVAKRNFVGIDVNPIATFVSKVKTTPLKQKDIVAVENWVNTCSNIKINDFVEEKNSYWAEEGYFKNIPWNIRRNISIYLSNLNKLYYIKQRNFAKCILLRTSQWALDCKENMPTTGEFRNKLIQTTSEFAKGILELNGSVAGNTDQYVSIFNNKAEDENLIKGLKALQLKPKLVITSPPYVGVQILYHQWQVNSRRRTRAPFWIVDSLDGHGSPHYTFGYYKTHAKEVYFENAKNVFRNLKEILHKRAIVVQLLGFSDHKKFLPLYLEAMDHAGFEEVIIKKTFKGRISRVWRNVPNRKWYIKSKDDVFSSKEVLLIHKVKL